MTAVIERERTWTIEEVEVLIIELLAETDNEDPDVLHRQLVDKDGAMPVDSLDMFDILAEFRRRTGLTIPKRKLQRRTMRSVKLFAEFVVKEAQE